MTPAFGDGSPDLPSFSGQLSTVRPTLMLAARLPAPNMNERLKFGGDQHGSNDRMWVILS